VSNETGVSVRLIERFLREGRLILTEDSPIYLKCENCGKEIKTGRFCQACSTNLSNEMRMTAKADETPSNRMESADKNRMRFLNRDI
jgi:ribosomal protein L32